MNAAIKVQTDAPAITPEDITVWWVENIKRNQCPALEILAEMAAAINDRRVHLAKPQDPMHVNEVTDAEKRRMFASKAADDFKKVVRRRQRWWADLHEARLKYEIEAAIQHGTSVPRNEPVERLEALLKLIADTEEFWNGPFARARDRQKRADWHLTARHLDNCFRRFWQSAGLKVSHTPKSNYAKFLAFAINHAEGLCISDTNVQSAFR